MERRLGVLLVADLVDYTRLMESDESSALGAVRSLRESLLEPKVTAQGGKILNLDLGYFLGWGRMCLG